MRTNLTNIARLTLTSLAVSTFVYKAQAQTQTDYQLAQRMQAAQTALSRMVAATGAPADQSVNASAKQPLGPKKPGVIRIGVFMPKYEMGSPGGPSAGESVRATEEQFLAGPKLEVVRISALLEIQATEEAKEKECDYFLTTTLSQKKSGGGFGALKTLSTVAPMASMLPGVGVAGAMAGIAATQSLAVASRTAMVASSSVKAKSEVTFEYSLHGVDGRSILKSSQKAKAKADGEDVITPMIQNAATEIVSALNK